MKRFILFFVGIFILMISAISLTTRVLADENDYWNVIQTEQVNQGTAIEFSKIFAGKAEMTDYYLLNNVIDFHLYDELYFQNGNNKLYPLTNSQINGDSFKLEFMNVDIELYWSDNGTHLIDGFLDIFGSSELEILDNDRFIITNTYFEYNSIKIYHSEFDNYMGIHLKIKSNLPDMMAPVITGQTTFVTNQENPFSVSYIISQLTAIDETDGPVNIVVENATDYEANKYVLGTYGIVISASDSTGNKRTATINVQVVDVTPPEIIASSSVVNIGNNETFNINGFIESMQIIDSYDGEIDKSSVYVKTNNYTANKTTLGTYTVVYAVKDSSNNEATFTKTIKVVDRTVPVISGPSTIETSNLSILTISDIKKRLTATDDIDGSITSKIEVHEDFYTGNGNKAGTYSVKFKVKDLAGNLGYHTVTIIRMDNISPKIWVEDGVSIRVENGVVLTHNQIINLLITTGQFSNATTTTYNVLYDEYSDNEDTPGTYLLSIEAKSQNGSEFVHNIYLTVLGESSGGITVDGVTKNMTITYVVLVVLLLGVVIVVSKRK